MNRLLEILNKININGSVMKDENMAKHTTFRCGGSAEFFIKPESVSDLLKIKQSSLAEGFPLFILGGGANLLVSDRGIPGVTISISSLSKIEQENSTLIVEAGANVNTVCDFALEKELTGFEFIYGMPGTIGGAVCMNARCYGDEISNHFLWAEYIDEKGSLQKLYKNESDWEYKKSPFQRDNIIITRVALEFKPGESHEIEKLMLNNRKDRRDKGHFSYPCAGSVFKNNRDFGAPSGKIIEDAGLKGLKYGNAQISDFHANIIVNLGGAKSSEIDYLINKTIEVVKDKTGFILEPEVLRVGNWEA